MVFGQRPSASAIRKSAEIAITLLAAVALSHAAYAEPSPAVENVAAAAGEPAKSAASSEMNVLGAPAIQQSEKETFSSSASGLQSRSTLASAAPTTLENAGTALRSEAHNVQLLDECIVVEICVDHYLWELYQRTAQLDTAKVHETRKVRFRRKNKTVTLTRHF